MHEYSSIIQVTEDENGKLFTAESFLNYLRLSKDHWHESGTRYTSKPADKDKALVYTYKPSPKWIFRGHWNANEWRLLPRLWRYSKDRVIKFCEDSQMEQLRLSFGQRSHYNFLLNLLKIFEEKLNVMAYPMPKSEDPWYGQGPCYSSKTIPIDLTCLAQHHGIPTHLLDWTYNPLNAAFFAVAKQFRDNNINDPICIWALDIDSPIFRDKVFDAPRIKIREQPRYLNEYLKAQQGLFTEVISSNKSLDVCEEFQCIETIIKNLKGKMGNYDTPILKKFILAKSEANNLLELLRKEGTNRTAIMPTLDNLALDVLDQFDLYNI